MSIHNGNATMAAQDALADAKRARDNALRSICELAQSLALLNEVITVADAETHRRLWAPYSGSATGEPNR